MLGPYNMLHCPQSLENAGYVDLYGDLPEMLAAFEVYCVRPGSTSLSRRNSLASEDVLLSTEIPHNPYWADAHITFTRSGQ